MTTTISQQDFEQKQQKQPIVSLVSETYIPQVLPPVFRTGDMIGLFLLNVFWVTNITPIAGGGAVGFLYWGICGVSFFIPCSIVMAQLMKMFPHEGSIINWTYHALGARWSFFIALCAWLPVILSIVNAAAAVISWVQAVHSQWLPETWQQGLAMLVVLGFTGILACQRTSMVKHVMNAAVIAMGIATVLIVSAAVLWLSTGHHSATNFAIPSNWTIQPANFALLGSGTLALLGSDMPLALSGEVLPGKKRSVLLHHLTWGTIFTLGGYLLFTFAVLTLQGAGVAANTVNPMILLISTVTEVFGKTIGNVMALCLVFYFLMIPVALHICSSRFLMVVAVDRRISIRFAKFTTHRIPLHALLAQITITMCATLVIYFLVPSISFGRSADLSSIAYNVIGASLLLVWAFSFLFPFINLAVFYFKKRDLFQKNHIQFFFLPRPLLTLLLGACVVLGILLCLATIGFTLLNSFIPTLIANSTWWYVIGGSALGCIVFFAALSLLTSSEADWEEMNR